MRQVEQILDLWAEAKQAGEAAVLATVVRTQGSAYRLPGARLLITRDGRRAGSVSGGCLEDDLVQKAWWFTESGPVVRRYDTTPDDEIGPAFGLGCNGIIHLLLERLLPHRTNPLDWTARSNQGRAPITVCSIVGPAAFVGGRLVAEASGAVTHNLEQPSLIDALTDLATASVALDLQAPKLCDLEGYQVFVETLCPPVRLLIFGAGDDAIPLTEVARLLGWEVIVYDGRSHYARQEKFPHAHQVHVRSGNHENAPLPIDPWTVAVLMTHSYSQDLKILRDLAETPPRYVGLLGPRTRSLQLLAEAALDPGSFADALHTPMGLDIGADGPEQVAIATVSEIQAVLNGRLGGPLRNRNGSIHSHEPIGSIACV